MPSFTSLFEDTSPYFSYTTRWRASRSSDDPLVERYSDSSATFTDVPGSTFSVTYYGSRVTVYGSKRPNYGTYEVKMQGITHPVGNSSSGGSGEEFNAILFDHSLAQGEHTLTLETLEEKTVDIDTVSWVTQIGVDNEPLIVNTIQDTHPNFVYEPDGAWNARPVGSEAFSGRPGHATSQRAALATLTFRGDCIALFGPAGPSGASYSVQVDDGLRRPFSTVKEIYRSRQLLYWAGGLGGNKSHTLKIQVDTQQQGERTFAIDYAEVYTTPSLGGSFDGVQSGASPSPPGTNPAGDQSKTASGLPVGAIAGLAVVSVVAVVALTALLVVLWRNRRRREGTTIEQPPSSSVTPFPGEMGSGFPVLQPAGFKSDMYELGMIGAARDVPNVAISPMPAMSDSGGSGDPPSSIITSSRYMTPVDAKRTQPVVDEAQQSSEHGGDPTQSSLPSAENRVSRAQTEAPPAYHASYIGRSPASTT